LKNHPPQRDWLFRSLIQNSMDIITILEVDGIIRYESPAVEGITGFKPEELIGKSVFEYIHPDDLNLVQSAFQSVITAPPHAPQTAEFRFRCRDGTWCYLEVNGTNLLADPSVAGIVINSRNISERKSFQAALAKSESKFRSLIQNSLDIITILSQSGCIIYESPSVENILGYTPEEMMGRLVFDFIHPDDLPSVEHAFQQILAHPQHSLKVELRFRHQNQSWHYLELVGNNLLADASVAGILINSRDISERKRTEQQLQFLACHDPLTQLANRTLFTEWLEKAFLRTKRNSSDAFAVLFLDLDRFKLINDSFGHAVGDRLLVVLAERLKTCLREVDTLAHWSGDEFAILLENITDVSQVTHVAERIQSLFQIAFDLEDREVFSSASIGIALSNSTYQSPEDILRDADIALYRAKERGKARFEIFDTDMHNRAVTLLRLETDLRQGLQREEFQLFFQPILSLDTGLLKGMEALLRWQHPQRGQISPNIFIPVAEETGLIHPLGWWIFEKSCEQILRWDRLASTDTPLTISINVSAQQFREPDLIERIDELLMGLGLASSRLCLEITESVLIENTEAVARTFSQLRAMGIQLYMDDFGTGYSSLNYLHRFPLNALKIDRSFVSPMNPRDKNFEVVKTIITLAKNLGIDVIAEGIETEQQLNQLKDLQCHFGQGFFFSRPINATEAEQFIIQNFQQYAPSLPDSSFSSKAGEVQH
jgi:diguanylate cyclase (GGDEF)-like protein/PAS domain S-box-containing protein